MDFREEFISRTKEKFAAPVNAAKVRKDAENMLGKYFNLLNDSLSAEIEATRGELEIAIKPKTYSIMLKGITLTITNHLSEIAVKIRRTGHHFEDKLIITEKGYLSEEYGMYLSKEILDNYLKEAFHKVL